MKKWIVFLLIIFVLAFTFNHFYSEFELSSRTGSTINLELNENYYFSYGLDWRGLFKPKLMVSALKITTAHLLASTVTA